MHPYRRAPATAFWSQSVSSNFDAATLIKQTEPLIKAHEMVASAGSCFASNLVPYLESNGFTYLRTEVRHPDLADIPPENLGYDKFSAGYGNIYTVRQLLQLLRRSFGRFKPVEDRWITKDGVIDPFRPGLKYFALNEPEFDALNAQHLRAVRRVFEQADVLIFTLGLTEAWLSRADGAVFPACPGTIAGSFDPSKHVFQNFTVTEIAADLETFIQELREINPNVRMILTVSPVPLVATATSNHVLCASTYSKSVLRVVAEQVSQKYQFVTYFPAYEIVTGPQAPQAFFEEDRRNVTGEAVKTVMSAFLAHCALADGKVIAQVTPSPKPSKPVVLEPTVSTPVKPKGAGAGDISELSRRIADAECEEAMVDPSKG